MPKTKKKIKKKKIEKKEYKGSTPALMKLSREQARELVWFCRNVLGVRQDMYATLDVVNTFAARLKRLEDTAASIEAYFKKFPDEKAPVDFSPCPVSSVPITPA